MKKIKQLDFFRFLAANIVIFLHQGKNTTWYNSFPSIFHQGQLMVLFFFVLSGFVLTYRFYDENINLKKFYFSRLEKLLPLYYLSLIISYIVQTFFRFSKRDWALVLSAFTIGVVLPMLIESEIWNR